MNAFTRAVGIELPIVQAPMAGGATTPELVAAVSNAGALGSYAAAYAQPAEITSAIAAIRSLTDRPFAVNVFAPLPVGDPHEAEAMLEVMAPLYADLGLAPPSLPARPPVVSAEQIDVLLESRVPVVSFTFGLIPDAAIDAFRSRGTYLIGTATTVHEADAVERAGVHAVVAQGSEAGGHRGTSEANGPGGMIGTMALVPQMVDAVRIPVLAAGGIMDGRGIAAARILGASAAQLGTAFLNCKESGLPRRVKDALVRANENDTVVTNAMTGRYGRAVRNRLIETLERSGVPPLPFAWQSALLGGLRRAAVEQGRADLLPLFAGQGLRLLRGGGAGELVRTLASEMEKAMMAIG